ncbi:MAG: Panacea domain-containing protein [Armatimonadetes bacterium]|nr:Panacea domain-containing protein [Armatimonadota bacterium]
MYLQRKSIEAAAYLLSKLGGEMPYIKLIKLLYLADREQVRRRGRTLSGDTHWSLSYGPVLELTLNSIKGNDPAWHEYIRTDATARVSWLVALPEVREMSQADTEVLDDTVASFGHLHWMELVDYTHTLPEWKEPRTGSRRRIYFHDIAAAVGHSPATVARLVAAQGERAAVQPLLDHLRLTGHA